MFKTEYIYEILSGLLSNEGYKHFISVVSNFVRKYNWPKTIIVSSETNSTKFWSIDEIKELTHQFFEWSLSKGKFDNLDKIPENYLSYYFSQILISFITNRIKEEQQKQGLSFEKCRELVISICKEDYINNTIEGRDYVFIHSFTKDDLKPNDDIENALTYLPKIPIKESTKHFKPLVKLAIEDIFNSIKTPISLNKLTKAVFSLFDQKSFNNNILETNEESIAIEEITETSLKYDKIIQKLLHGLTKDDAKLISHFLFRNEKEQSLAELANLYKIPKSTFHHKVDTFKKKIASSYTPENEQDGILFIQNISKALDDYSK
jgi:hypothetical protein